MTIEDAGFMRLKAQYEIFMIVKDLMTSTKCRVTAINVITEEGFALQGIEVVGVEIKLEVV